MLKKSNKEQFEKTFADLAFSGLKDRSPKIIEYLIGFQMLDKSDDDTKGAGIFVFDIGGMTYYGPVFFIKGKLEGNNLLYAKKANQFFPLQEKWVNYIINSKKPTIGIGDKTKDPKSFSYPDLSTFREPPTTEKFASDILNTKLGAFDDFDLMKILPMLTKEAKVVLAKTMQQDEQFAEAVMQFYDVGALLKTSSYTHVIPKKVKQSNVLDVILPSTENVDLTSNEISCMIRDGVVLRDKRASTSPVYENDKITHKVETVTSQFMNPEPGMIAGVLFSDGSINKCLILRDVVNDKYMSSDRSSSSFNLIVVEMVAPNRVVKAESRDIFILAQDAEQGKDNFKMWHSQNASKVVTCEYTGKDESDISSSREHDGSLIVDIYGACVFAKKAIAGIKPGTSIFKLNGYPDITRQPKYNNASDTGDGIKSYDRGCLRYPDTLIVTAGNSITVSANTTFVPFTSVSIVYANQRAVDTHVLGSPLLLGLDALKGSEYKSLKINSDGVEFSITDDAGNQSKPIGKSAAIIKLATLFGIHGDDAARIVNKVMPSPGLRNQYKFIIKQAGFDEVNQLDFDADLGISVRRPRSSSDTIEELSAESLEQIDPRLSDKTRQAAITAAANGNKEILDTSILAGLVNTTGPTALVDSYLGTLIAGLDRIGRITFLFYWHSDKLSDRYGKTDLTALEDSLKNVFNSLGDLVLFLKEKTANLDNLLASTSVELDNSF